MNTILPIKRTCKELENEFHWNGRVESDGVLLSCRCKTEVPTTYQVGCLRKATFELIGDEFLAFSKFWGLVLHERCKNLKAFSRETVLGWQVSKSKEVA
jgi:hypothetical protein